MTKYDYISSIFFLGMSIVIILESIRLGPGSLSNPGPGLIPLGSGFILGILSVIVFALTFKRSSQESIQRQGKRFNFNRRIISTLVSMLVFGFLVNPLGFYVATILWMCFVCRWIARLGWRGTIITSVAATITTWSLFGYLLEIRFPRGIWGG